MFAHPFFCLITPKLLHSNGVVKFFANYKYFIPCFRFKMLELIKNLAYITSRKLMPAIWINHLNMSNPPRWISIVIGRYL